TIHDISPVLQHVPRAQYDLHSFPTRRSSDLFHISNNSTEKLIGELTAEKKLSLSDVQNSPYTALLLGAMIVNFADANNESLMMRSEEHTSELQSRFDIVCRLLLEKKQQANHQ